MDSGLKSTPLAAEHIALGAKMVPFAGWNMPVQYSEGILAEHKHTREKASLFDICHMGEFVVRGIGSSLALDTMLARPSSDRRRRRRLIRLKLRRRRQTDLGEPVEKGLGQVREIRRARDELGA